MMLDIPKLKEQLAVYCKYVPEAQRKSLLGYFEAGLKRSLEDEIIIKHLAHIQSGKGVVFKLERGVAWLESDGGLSIGTNRDQGETATGKLEIIKMDREPKNIDIRCNGKKLEPINLSGNNPAFITILRIATQMAWLMAADSSAAPYVTEFTKLLQAEILMLYVFKQVSFFERNKQVSIITDLAKHFVEQIKLLGVNEYLILPTGYKGNPNKGISGHSMYVCYKKIDHNQVEVIIFNYGRGVEYHYQDGKNASAFAFEVVAAKDIDSRLNKQIAELLNLRVVKLSDDSEKDSILNKIYNSLPRPLYQVMRPNTYRAWQYASNCSWYSQAFISDYTVNPTFGSFLRRGEELIVKELFIEKIHGNNFTNDENIKKKLEEGAQNDDGMEAFASCIQTLEARWSTSTKVVVIGMSALGLFALTMVGYKLLTSENTNSPTQGLSK